MQKTFAAISLCLALIASSIAFGVAQGQPRIVGEMVICLGSITVTVSVDEQGRPVEHVHVCPDGIMGSLSAVALPTAPVVQIPYQVVALYLSPWRKAFIQSSWRSGWTARGPPTASL